MLNNTSKGRSPLAFFLLTAALGLPIFIFAGVQVFPNILLFNFAAFLPATAAMILVYRESGTAGVAELLRRSVDPGRIRSRIWYVPILLTWPFIALVQCLLAFLSGEPVSSPHFSFWTPIGLVIIFIAALGEELGWMGYAFEPMQERFGALKASLLLGVVWASAHIPLFTASGASSGWIIWQWIYIAAARVLFVWVYNNAGKSLFAVVLMHTLFNTIWQFFPPRAGSAGLLVPSFYNPSSLAITTAVLAAIVTFLWGPKTLAQYRYARIDEK